MASHSKINISVRAEACHVKVAPPCAQSEQIPPNSDYQNLPLFTHLLITLPRLIFAKRTTHQISQCIPRLTIRSLRGHIIIL
jgi:hypothetical protein